MFASCTRWAPWSVWWSATRLAVQVYHRVDDSSRSRSARAAPLEFRAVSYDANAQPRLTSMNDDAVWKTAGCNKFGLLPGQWTDDASMSLCLAESLLEHGRLHERDLRLRFLLWWQLGYCNAFGHDQQRLHGGSVGLGGNIGSSFEEFKDRRTRFTTAGNRATSGNGSLMRLAPAAVFFARAPPDETPAQRQQRYDAAMRLAYLQSKTTHQGDEAAECCRLLTYVLLTAIDDAAATPDDSGATRAQRVLGALPGTFRSPLHSVTALANSARETACRENRHLDLADRDWRWRARQYRYCEKRARSQPGYVGSYCMDALAMALHCAWHNATLPAAMLHCANLRGDADTTTAITAQLVGALHGIEAIPAAWLARVAEWDPHGLLFVRAHRLYQREHVANAASDDDNDDEEEPVTRDRNAEVDSDDETPNGAADGGDGGGDDDTDDDNDDVDNDDDNDTDNGTCNGNADDDEDSEATLELAQSAAVLTDDGPGFAVEPRECVHVEAISVTYDAVHALSSTLNANQCSEAECKGCTSENWLCVGCLQLFCGRYHNAHAKAHFSAKPTCGAVAIGYAGAPEGGSEHARSNHCVPSRRSVVLVL